MSTASSTWFAKPRLWAWGLRELARLGRPDVAFGFLGGLGDELLCTSALVEWRRRDARNIWVMTTHPALFSEIDPLARIVPSDLRYPRLCAAVGREFRFLGYSRYEPETDRDTPPSRHLVAEVCRRSGLSGRVTLRPYLRPTAGEIAGAVGFHGQVAIQTSTLTAHVPMRNKQWPAERFQEIVDYLAPAWQVVQLGSAADPPLLHVTDLRGRTSLRESAAILHQARLFVGPVGFLMHLARAVECPAVIVYGGRETPELTGYVCNANVVHHPPCAPCWQRSRCDFAHACTESITAAAVIAAIQTMLARPRAPLAVEELEL